MRNDPETSTTTQRPAPHQTNVPVKQPKGLVRLEQGSFRSSGVTLPGADASAAAAAAGARPHKEASNVLLVDGERSATGTPIMVGGPQIGYNYPGLTMEMGLYGPTLRARGATSAPFPGYMLIGRGEGFAGRSPPRAPTSSTRTPRSSAAARSTKYVYKGKCRKMKTVNAGTIAKGDDSVKVRYRQTVHGPVVGYARVAGSGKRVALSPRSARAWAVRRRTRSSSSGSRPAA